MRFLTSDGQDPMKLSRTGVSVFLGSNAISPVVIPQPKKTGSFQLQQKSSIVALWFLEVAIPLRSLKKSVC